MRWLNRVRRRIRTMKPARPAPPQKTSPEAAACFPPSLMHLPVAPARAPIVMLDPDADTSRSREAVARVVEAYHAAMRVREMPAPSMWAGVEAQQEEVLATVRERNMDAARDTLGRLFHTHLIWGLGRVHPLTPQHLRSGEEAGFQQQVTDALVSLAEAVGASRITSIEQQGIDAHLAALSVDLDEVLRAVVKRTGLELGMPETGGNYGCRIGRHRVSIDTLVHGYTVHRLRQLDVGPDECVAEIGGGYGCLAYVFARNGFRNYTIYDLPWVNLIQGYLLLMTLPPSSVSLFGEADAPIRVRPFWEFSRLPDRSVDVVINTDSLPEIGEETGRQYISDIARAIRRYFLSINQEAMMDYPGVGRQLHVNALCAREPRLRLLHRHRYWMRQGYVEELFAPAGLEH